MRTVPVPRGAARISRTLRRQTISSPAVDARDVVGHARPRKLLKARALKPEPRSTAPPPPSPARSTRGGTPSKLSGGWKRSDDEPLRFWTSRRSGRARYRPWRVVASRSIARSERFALASRTRERRDGARVRAAAWRASRAGSPDSRVAPGLTSRVREPARRRGTRATHEDRARSRSRTHRACRVVSARGGSPRLWRRRLCLRRRASGRRRVRPAPRPSPSRGGAPRHMPDARSLAAPPCSMPSSRATASRFVLRGAAPAQGNPACLFQSKAVGTSGLVGRGAVARADRVLRRRRETCAFRGGAT